VATAIIGDTFTFHTKFVTSQNVTFIPPDPTIEVFYFDMTGARVDLVAAGTPMTPVAADPGRFGFLMMIDVSLPAGLTIYALMRGTDSSTGLEAIVESDVELLTTATTTPSTGGGGLVARFIKGC
jgi:hypothetical protein